MEQERKRVYKRNRDDAIKWMRQVKQKINFVNKVDVIIHKNVCLYDESPDDMNGDAFLVKGETGEFCLVRLNKNESEMRIDTETVFFLENFCHSDYMGSL